MKNIWNIAFCTITLSLALTGCGDAEKTPEKEDTLVESESKEKKQDKATVNESIYPITYVDALGKEVVIEKEPKRVISAMHVLYPDVLLALGIAPIGIASADTQFSTWEVYQSYIEKHEFVDIGEPRNPNIEKILSLQPDLIFAAANVHDSAYDQLSAIAPVIYFDQRKMQLDRTYAIQEISKAIGKGAEGKALLAQIDEKIATGRKELAKFASKGETVLFATAYKNGNFGIYGENIAPTNKENGLGLTIPANYPKDITKEISMEGMSVLNPEHIFIFLDKNKDGQTIAEDGLKELEKSSVWNSIPAVKNGNIYIVDRSLFAQDAPLATMYGIDKVVDILKDK
ncbi:MAG: iron-siderophore ABC transporter substrate-binding protein [Lysinibacillus sp.]